MVKFNEGDDNVFEKASSVLRDGESEGLQRPSSFVGRLSGSKTNDKSEHIGPQMHLPRENKQAFSGKKQQNTGKIYFSGQPGSPPLMTASSEIVEAHHL